MSGKRDPLRRRIVFPEALRTVTGEVNLTKLPSELLVVVGTVGDGIAIIMGALGLAVGVAAGARVGGFLPTGLFWTEGPVESVGLRKW